jgi:hypothetical protein
MKYTIRIIAILITFSSTAAAQQSTLLNKTWKVKQLNTVYHTSNTSLFHKDSATNTMNYADLEFTFQPAGTYTMTNSVSSNQGAWEFNTAGDSVTIDGTPYLLMQLNADSFTTRSFSLQVADATGTLDTAYTFMKLYSLAALPVNLMSFSGKLAGEKVELTWITAQEQNNKEFEIQYSATGSSFETIGKVAGKGNANTVSQYSFSTLRYTTGKNYYRLKQVDFDGRSTLSRIVIVEAAAQGKPLISFSPNPASDKIRVSVTQAFSARLQLSLTNITGKQVWTGSLPAGATSTTIFLHALNKGTYILAAVNSKGEKVFYDKLVIQ